MQKRKNFQIGILIMLGVLFFITLGVFGNSNEIEYLFEQKYKAWKEWVRDHWHLSTYGANEPFREIAKLGIPALPYIIEKIEKNPNDFHLGFAVFLITKKQFEKTEWPEGKRGDSITAARLYVDWWKEGRKETPQQFRKLYSEWRNLKDQGKDKEAKEKYQRIRKLGIVALPSIMEKIERGDTDLIPLVSYLTDGAVKKDAKRSKCLNWWYKNKEKWIIPN